MCIIRIENEYCRCWKIFYVLTVDILLWLLKMLLKKPVKHSKIED